LSHVSCCGRNNYSVAHGLCQSVREMNVYKWNKHTDKLTK
jgi:hypothetical protein